ncbi:hypothetical protein [Parasediminibacterium sp. JCM 36343]|uniref:hypothetical protein n=1 Tax=Parasediminibacterium sp. JCM 36343 TaxID=3374279 RepID=UPI00397C580E
MKHTTKPKALLFYVAFFLFTALVSCTKEKYDFGKFASNQWDPEFAVAIVNGSMKITDFNLTASNGFVQTNSDSSMSIVVNGHLSTFKTSDFIPSFTSAGDVTSRSLSPDEKAAYNLIPVGVKDSFRLVAPQTVNLAAQSASQMDIDSIKLKTGIVSITIQNQFNNACLLYIKFPTVKNIPTTLVNIPANGSVTKDIDVSKQMLDLTNGGTTTNTLGIVDSIILVKASPDNGNGKLVFSGVMKNPQLDVLYGDVHQQDFFNTQSKDISLDIFKSPQPTGTLRLNNASIKLLCSSSFGVPLSFTITSVKGANGTNPPFFLNAAGIAPFVIPGGYNTTVFNSLTLDKDNPPTNGQLLNLPDFLSKFPTTFYPQFIALSNPGPKNVHNKNIIHDTSSGNVDALITIPLDFTVSNFAIKDTFDYKFTNIDNIKSIIIRTWFNNGFPISVRGSLVFTDKSFNKIFAFDTTQLKIAPGITDPVSGKVIAKTPNLLDFPLDSTVIPNLSKVAKVIFTGSISSPSDNKGGNLNSKIYSFEGIDIKIGARAKLKI